MLGSVQTAARAHPTRGPLTPGPPWALGPPRWPRAPSPPLQASTRSKQMGLAWEIAGRSTPSVGHLSSWRDNRRCQRRPPARHSSTSNRIRLLGMLACVGKFPSATPAANAICSIIANLSTRPVARCCVLAARPASHRAAARYGTVVPRDVPGSRRWPAEFHSPKLGVR